MKEPKHIKDLLPGAAEAVVGQASTATPAPPTPGRPATIRAWEEYLVKKTGFQTLKDPQLEAMLLASATLLHEMATGGPPRWLTLLGTSGAGKTMLGRGIHTAVKELGLTKSHVSDPVAEGIGSYYRAEYRVHIEKALEKALREREWDWFDDVCKAKFALVDEICGIYVPADISAPKLCALAERRLNKWTVLTGNVSMETIKQKWDARIASRILRGGSIVLDVDVPDYNLPNHGRKAR